MSGTSPCASCKLLRRRCAKDCIFAPFFPSDNPHKFAIVHKVFGASNVSKMLQELPIEQRGDAVSSLVYEANARMRDPVYGCVGAISNLQNQVSHLQMQLAVAQAKILCIQMQYEELQPTPLISTDHHHPNQRRLGQNPELDLQYDESSTYEMMQGEFINFPSSSNVAQEPFKRVTLDIKLSDKIR